MSSLLQSDGPVLVTAGGRELSVPRLRIRDYLPWIAELHKRWVDAAPASISPGTSPQERFRILHAIRLNEPTPDDLVPLVFTVDGTVRVLTLALARSGCTAADADALIDSLSPYDAKRLAFEVAGLLSAERFEQMFGPARPPAPAAEAAPATFGGARPLPEAGDAPAAG